MSPLTLAILCGSQHSTGDRSFDGGRVGLAAEKRGLSVCSSSTEGTSACQVKRRIGQEGRLFHLSHCPSRPTRASTHTCRFSGSPDDFAHDGRCGLQCGRTGDARSGSPPFQGRVVCGERHRQRCASADSTLHEPTHAERRQMRRVAKRTRPARSGCPVRHRETPLALNIWHGPRKTVNRVSASTGIRLRQANFLDEDFQEKNPGHVLGEVAAGTCEERYSGRQDAFDELHGATLKGILRKEVSLFLVELTPGEVCRGIGEKRPMSVLPVVPHEEFDRSSLPACAPLSAERHLICSGTMQLRAIVSMF